MPDWDRLPGIGPHNSRFDNLALLVIWAVVALAILTGLTIELLGAEQSGDGADPGEDSEELTDAQNDQTQDSEVDSSESSQEEDSEEQTDTEPSDGSTEGDPDEGEQTGSSSEDTSEGEDSGPADNEQDATDGSESPSDGSNESDDAGETATETQWVLSATVVDVVDGDTVDVQLANGSADTVRLLGVDTPEVHSSTTPSEFEGVPSSEAGRDCLRSVGQNATSFVESEIGGDEIELHLDNESDRRGGFGRLLAYVLEHESNLNYVLVEEGYARVYDSEFEQRDRFYEAESAAQSAGIGVWSCRDVDASEDDDSAQEDGGGEGELSVARIHADASGNDHDNLNDEYIVFANTGSTALDISGWVITDEADHSYSVPSGTVLDPGEEITLYTGSGSDSDSSLYWSSGRAVWNNGGDTITVRNDSGGTVLSESYS